MTPMATRRKWILGGLAATAGCGLLLIVCGVAGYYLYRFMGGPGSFPGRKLTAVLEALRREPLEADVVVRYRLNKQLEADSLRPLAVDEHIQRGAGRGTVRVLKNREGDLMILIVTQDWGHAGEQGFLYSDVDPLPVPIPEELVGDWEIGSRVSDHWWEAYFNLG